MKHRPRTAPRRRVALLALTFLTVIAAVFAAPPAGAHAADETYVYLDVTESSLSGRIEFGFGDLQETFGIDVDLDTDAEVALERIEAELATLQAYADEHFEIVIDGQSAPLTFDGVELLFENNDGDFNFALLGFEADLGGADVPREFDVTFDPFFETGEERIALLLIANDWGAGTIENEEESLVSFSADNRTRSIDLGDTSQWSNFTASIWQGVDHIRTGPDHIFFVMVLLLPSVLVFTSRWEPAPTFGASLWRVLKIATMFTVAHSITFTPAGMDILPLPPSAFVESLIAFSIALAALHNLRPIADDKEWAIAFGFGLFHGMGFAGLVAGLDVSRSTQLVSLLGRNVGIEIGQAIVILILFPALFLLRRTVAYRPIFVAGSLLLFLVSAIWTVERVFDQDFGISPTVDSIIAWPRVLVPIVVATILAAMLERRTAAAGELIPVAQVGADESPAEDLVDA